MGLLTRDDLLRVDDIPFEDVDVPEWGEGVSVRVRGLNAQQRALFTGTAVASQKAPPEEVAELWSQLEMRLVAMSLVDENGDRLLGDDEVSHIAERSPAVVSRLFRVVQSLSKLGGDAVEEAAGNSEAAPSDASSSD